MKTLASLLMMAMILLSSLMLPPSAPTAEAKEKRNNLETSLTLETKLAAALLVQDDPVMDEVRRRCAENAEALKNALKGLEKMTARLAAAIGRAMRAAGRAGQITADTIRATFPRVWRILLSRGMMTYLGVALFEVVGAIDTYLFIVDEIDEAIEGAFSLDLQETGMPKEEADRWANYVSDTAAHIDMMMGGTRAPDAAIRHYRELLQESRKCELEHKPRRRSPELPRPKEPGQYRPSTDGFPGIGRLPCGASTNTLFDGPSLPPSEPGSNDTEDSFDDGMTVTTSPCS